MKTRLITVLLSSAAQGLSEDLYGEPMFGERPPRRARQTGPPPGRNRQPKQPKAPARKADPRDPSKETRVCPRCSAPAGRRCRGKRYHDARNPGAPE